MGKRGCREENPRMHCAPFPLASLPCASYMSSPRASRLVWVLGLCCSGIDREPYEITMRPRLRDVALFARTTGRLACAICRLDCKRPDVRGWPKPSIVRSWLLALRLATFPIIVANRGTVVAQVCTRHAQGAWCGRRCSVLSLPVGSAQAWKISSATVRRYGRTRFCRARSILRFMHLTSPENPGS